jgi:hypothetical protein
MKIDLYSGLEPRLKKMLPARENLKRTVLLFHRYRRKFVEENRYNYKRSKRTISFTIPFSIIFITILYFVIHPYVLLPIIVAILIMNHYIYFNLITKASTGLKPLSGMELCLYLSKMAKDDGINWRIDSTYSWLEAIRNYSHIILDGEMDSDFFSLLYHMYQNDCHEKIDYAKDMANRYNKEKEEYLNCCLLLDVEKHLETVSTQEKKYYPLDDKEMTKHILMFRYLLKEIMILKRPVYFTEFSLVIKSFLIILVSYGIYYYYGLFFSIILTPVFLGLLVYHYGYRKERLIEKFIQSIEKLSISKGLEWNIDRYIIKELIMQYSFLIVEKEEDIFLYSILASYITDYEDGRIYSWSRKPDYVNEPEYGKVADFENNLTQEKEKKEVSCINCGKLIEISDYTLESIKNNDELNSFLTEKCTDCGENVFKFN